ncbi:MAG: peptidoglycan-binding domain-containing protein [Pseudomonadota bacterium]
MNYIFMSMAAALGALAACAPLPNVAVTRAEPEPLRTRMEGPPAAKPGECWGRDVTPAIFETVTEQILLQPAEIGTDGTVRKPPIYKSETRQAIVRERRDIWFQTPCEADLTPDFIASLQRALAARNLYRGAVNGVLDARTRRAVRAYQAPQGLNSAILSLAAARQMGLVAIARDPDIARPEEKEPDA